MCSDILTKGSVDIKDLTVTLTCPLNEDGVTWFINDNEITKETAGILTLRNYDDKMNGFYKCKTTEKMHYFYIKAKGKCMLMLHKIIKTIFHSGCNTVGILDFFFFAKQSELKLYLAHFQDTYQSNNE